VAGSETRRVLRPRLETWVDLKTQNPNPKAIFFIEFSGRGVHTVFILKETSRGNKYGIGYRDWYLLSETTDLSTAIAIPIPNPLKSADKEDA
jgi:hypothetical protein